MAAYEGRRVLDRVDLDVEPGGIHAVLGPSGCGKTTLLKVLAGLKAPEGGRVLLDDEDVTAWAPERRGIVLLHQENTLFPHLDVARNVGFGLRFAGGADHDRGERIRELLALVGLPGHETRRTHQLSGGERQRVALARALAVRPRVLLLDEPLSHLDQPLRVALRGEIRRILAAANATALYVTHDREEAFAVADRLMVMDAGRIVDAGPPRRLHDAPANARAAALLGRRNIVPYHRAADGRAVAPWGGLDAPLPPEAPAAGRLLLREEELDLRAGGPGAEATVAALEYLGGRYRVEVRLGADRLYVETPDASGWRVGDLVRLDASRARPVAWPEPAGESVARRFPTGL